MRTCAIYARVSAESQVKGDSIQHQIALSREFLRRRNLEDECAWVSPESLIYIDEGITGLSMVKRPAVQRLIQDARLRKFDVVLFKGISRFARDTVDSLLMLRTLITSGVRVISMEENFDSERDNAEFVFTIHSALAQAESEKTAIRVRVGVLEKAKTGRWNGKPPDGYHLNPITKKLEIDDAFAHIIYRIYQLYRSGLGCRSVAQWLNQNGHYTKRGCYWSARTIARVLRNPAYAGDVVYGRQEKHLVMPDESNPLSRRRKATSVRDPNQIAVCKDAHPAIVDRATFETVQAMLERHQVQHGRLGKQHLLTRGILRCQCGSPMTIKYNAHGTPYYRCIGQQDKGRTYCNQQYIRADSVESAVLARIRTDVEELTPLVETELPVRNVQRFEEQLKKIQKQLDKQLEKSQILFDQYTDGQLVDAQFSRMNQVIQARIVALQDALKICRAHEDRESSYCSGQSSVRITLRESLTPPLNDKKLTRKLIEVLVHEVIVLQTSDRIVGVRINYRFARLSALSL